MAHLNDVMATGGSDNCVRIWDLRMGKVLQECTGHSGKVCTVDCVGFLLLAPMLQGLPCYAAGPQHTIQPR